MVLIDFGTFFLVFLLLPVCGNECLKLECCNTDFCVVSSISILVFICWSLYLSDATASRQEQSGDFLCNVKVDEDSQEMPFGEGQQSRARER